MAADRARHWRTEHRQRVRAINAIDAIRLSDKSETRPVLDIWNVGGQEARGYSAMPDDPHAK